MKIAVIFPGIGYTADKPLLYYARRIAENHGYEIKVISFSGFPSKVKGDRSKMVESFNIALKQAENSLKGIDFSVYSDVVFIGKSIGTIVAAKLASENPSKDKIRLVLYTPLEDTFSFEISNAIAFTGSADPWVGGEKSRIPEMCKVQNIPYTLIPGGNHSLETKNPESDLKSLCQVMSETEQFMKLRS